MLRFTLCPWQACDGDIILLGFGIGAPPILLAASCVSPPAPQAHPGDEPRFISIQETHVGVVLDSLPSMGAISGNHSKILHIPPGFHPS